MRSRASCAVDTVGVSLSYFILALLMPVDPRPGMTSGGGTDWVGSILPAHLADTADTAADAVLEVPGMRSARSTDFFPQGGGRSGARS